MATCRLLMPLALFITLPVTAFSGFGSDVDAYIDEAAQRYQIPTAMLRGLVKMENGWKNNISPTGATGVGQFTFKTWNWLASMPEGQAIGMKPISHRTRGTHADPRLNKRVNTLATGLLTRLHIQKFAERGIKSSDDNLYMAHNIGFEGFHRAILGKATHSDIRNMRRNGMKHWMSVQDFLNYQKNRYNTHKKIANSIYYPTINNENKVSIARNQKATSKMNDSLTATKLLSTKTSISDQKNQAQRVQPTLRWIQPSDKQITWINPIQRL